MPVLSCACMFMLSEAGLVFSCFASNAKKNNNKIFYFFGSHILHRNTRLSVATPWDQLLRQTDGQTVPLSFSSQPTNPTSQIAGLIKCWLLQGSVWFLLVRCHSQCMMQQLQTKGSSRRKTKMGTVVIQLQCNLSFSDEWTPLIHLPWDSVLCDAALFHILFQIQ